MSSLTFTESKLMQRTATCHRGSLQITVTGEPEWVNLCHCKACQRRTGAVVHCGAYFSAAGVTIAGASKTYTRPADSGYEIRFHFCPECGSNVYWQASGFPRHCGVAVGAFADPTFLPPSFSVWEESMHRWLRLMPGIERFARGRTGKPLGTDEAAC
jgi:hypothetical protein